MRGDLTDRAPTNQRPTRNQFSEASVAASDPPRDGRANRRGSGPPADLGPGVARRTAVARAPAHGKMDLGNRLSALAAP
jgi:hypothetical protein